MANIYIPASNSIPFEHITKVRPTEESLAYVFFDTICSKI
jgi:hypothetical protein